MSDSHDRNAWSAVARIEGTPCTDTDGAIGHQLAVATNAVDVEWHCGQRTDARPASAFVANNGIRGAANDVVGWRVLSPATVERLGCLTIEDTSRAEKNSGYEADATDA